MKESYDYFYDYSSEFIICETCNISFKRGKATLEYLGSSFPVELQKSPKCNNVFIEESSVYTNMIRVERL